LVLVTPPDIVVYLVRHGRTPLNAEGVLRGRLDPPLDVAGRAEAAVLGDLFVDVPLAAVVTSPLSRARETAEPIAATTGAPLNVDPALTDRDYGQWAGTSQDEVECRFGSLDAAPGVELAEAFAARVASALNRLADRWAPGPIAVVAHEAVNRYALDRLVPGLGPPGVIRQRTGCWNRLERASGSWGAPIVDGIPGDGRRP
jgi:glucosyl-3-phosphoglycerate phosphatase